MKFRRHRLGLTLAESMETLVDLEATKKAIADHLGIIDSEPLRVEWYMGPDVRIGWAENWIVYDAAGAYGFTDGPVDGETK